VRSSFKSVADRIPRPFPRTPKGATSWHSIISKACPSIVPDALREAISSAEDGRLSKQGRLKLKGEVAIRARDNVTDVALEIYEDMEAENKRCEAKLKVLEPVVVALERDVTALKVTYASACAMVPITPKADGAAAWGEDEPLSLEEIAADKRLPIPDVVPDLKSQRWLMEGGAVASALMFSIGLQAVRGEELDQVLQNPVPFLVISGISYGITRLIGASSAIIGLGAGDHVARSSLESEGMRNGAKWIAFIAPLPLSFCLGIAIESAVDYFGISKSIIEASSSATVHPSPLVMGTISLFVSYPLFLFYSVRHFHFGYYRTLQAQLKLIQKQLRKAVKAETWKAVESASATLMPKLKKLAEKQKETEDAESKIRYELNEAEVNRLLDLNEKALSCDLELREEMGYDKEATKSRSILPIPSRSRA
jgi:hypothetical protein